MILEHHYPMKRPYTFTLLFCMLLLPAMLMAQKPPVEGDDLIDLLGKRKENLQVKDMTDFIGDDYQSKGVKLGFRQGKVSSIELFNDKNPFSADIKRFQGVLPRGLSFRSKVVEVKKALGEGAMQQGELTKDYYLMKEYTLNTLDAYRITFYYYGGRMLQVSIDLQKGAAGAAEEKAATKKLDIRGGDYVYMIKKNSQNRNVKKLVKYLGEPTYKDRNVRDWVEKGAAMEMDNKGNVTWLGLYNKGQRSKWTGKTYKAYTHLLPFGVKFNDGRDIITKKAGHPDKTEGSTMIYNISYAQVKIHLSGGGIAFIEMMEQPEEDE